MWECNKCNEWPCRCEEIERDAFLRQAAYSMALAIQDAINEGIIYPNDKMREMVKKVLG